MNTITRNGVTLTEGTWYEDQSDTLDAFFGDENEDFLDCMSFLDGMSYNEESDVTMTQFQIIAVNRFFLQRKINMLAVAVKAANPPVADEMFQWQFTMESPYNEANKHDKRRADVL